MKCEALSVTGISCNGCEQNIENALRNIGGVTLAEADHEVDTVEVVIEDDVTDEDLYDAIENTGYDVAA